MRPTPFPSPLSFPLPWRIALLLLLTLGAPARSRATVLITEFMAANGTGLRDEDNAYSDWIEIYNSASTNVNTAGWYLTDNAAQLTKWQFPSTNIAPNSFLIVFASSKNRRVPGQPLHANFSLSASGEYLALVKPGGVVKTTEFAPQFPNQYQDISYGFTMNGVPETLLGAGTALLRPLPDATRISARGAALTGAVVVSVAVFIAIANKKLDRPLRAGYIVPYVVVIATNI